MTNTSRQYCGKLPLLTVYAYWKRGHSFVSGELVFRDDIEAAVNEVRAGMLSLLRSHLTLLSDYKLVEWPIKSLKDKDEVRN